MEEERGKREWMGMKGGGRLREGGRVYKRSEERCKRDEREGQDVEEYDGGE